MRTTEKTEIFRPTAVPLVTIDPYFSIWSFNDCLSDTPTRHWTGRRANMSGFIEVDGTWYRFMGEVISDVHYRYRDIPRRLNQTMCNVEATETTYVFENSLIKLTIRFRTPMLPDDLYLLSRPVSYISYEISYKDQQAHTTKVYFDLCSEVSVNDFNQEVEFGKTDYSVFCGRGNCDVLQKADDDIMIDWGYAHLVMPDAEYYVLDNEEKLNLFYHRRGFKGIVEKRKVIEGHPVLAGIRDYGETTNVSDFLCVAYDDIFSIEYFNEKIKAYWTTNGDGFEDVIKKAVAEYSEINKRCDAFDIEFREKAKTISDKYADLLALSYRQIMGAHKLVEKEGKLLYFSKECFSNGCIGTVDITYPSLPMYLIYNTELAKALLNPVFEYVECDKGWKYEFAPHDLGCYPKANGQVYGCEEPGEEYFVSRQMPVEECGNMMLCVAAICKMEGNAEFARDHIFTLRKWADYLVKTGWNPGKQLCTDDFAGHLAHNCNLSLKGILAIGAFSQILDTLNLDGSVYMAKAREFAAIWQKEAFDGKCYRLAFDQEGTWSLKYNIVWDKFFGLNLFPEEVSKCEVEFYKTKMNEFGIPLDNRADYTKSDWQMWTTCMCDDKEYRTMIIDAMWHCINKLEQRAPFPDWYRTSEAFKEGFQGRTVQGGLFMPLLF